MSATVSCTGCGEQLKGNMEDLPDVWTCAACRVGVLLCKVCGTEVVGGCSCGKGTMELVRMLTRMRDDAAEEWTPEHAPGGAPALDVAVWLRDYVPSAPPNSPAEEAPAAVPRETWCWGASPDAERWHGGFATREEAVEDGERAAHEGGYQKFFVQRGLRCTPWEFVPAGYQILDQIHDAAEDECGDPAEDYPDVSPEGHAELNRVLQAWATRHITAPLYRTSGKVELVTAAGAGKMRWAAVSHVERDDGKVLAVWHKKGGGWAMPGGKVEDGEPVAVAQARELYEETGLDTDQAKLVFVGDGTVASTEIHVFRVDVAGKPREMEEGSPVTWLTRDELVQWSPFAEFYRKYFAGRGA